jgi:hypothetical protein
MYCFAMTPMTGMKCSVIGCTNVVTGYFIEAIDVSNSDSGRASIDADKTCWCDDHKAALLPHTVSKLGHYRTV